MKVIGKEDEEEKSTLTEQRTKGGIGGRQQDYIDFINYYKDSDEHDIVVAKMDDGQVVKVGFSGKDYEEHWVKPDMPTNQYETFDDRKSSSGFNDFETMSNTQRQKSDAMKLGTVNGSKGLLYDRTELDDEEDDKLTRAINDMFNELDDFIRAEIEQEDEPEDEDE